MTRWYFQPILGSYLVVAVFAAGLVLLLLLSPAFGRLRSGRRRTLKVLRTSVIVLVIVAMLRPTLVSTKSRPQSSTLVVLMDRSRSMDIADAPGEKTRWQAQREAVLAAASELRELREQMEVGLYLFDSEAHSLEFTRNHVRLNAKPSGEQSDLGTSLDDVLRQAAGKRLAAVILMSDGAQRALAPRVDIQQPARELARLGYPLYTIAFGLPRDEVQARDVAIERLDDHYTVFVKNELELRALLRSQGYVNQQIPVQLVVESADGQTETLGPVPLQPKVDGEQLEVRFTYTPQRAGQYKLTLQALEQPGELVTENNQLSAFLTVLEGGLRVLYVYGGIVSGQNIEIQSISASPDIQLDHRWIDPRRRKNRAIDLDEQLSGDEYDVFLIGDLDADALERDNLAALAEAVIRGKGLMMLGGYHSFGPGGYQNTAIADVLPIMMGRYERQRFDAPRRADVHINREIVLVPARPHFVTFLEAANLNEAAWRQLPPLVGANKFAELKAARAQVLLQSESGEPILVAGGYGKGRVLALAAESTSRWYRYGFQSQHKRFWRQAILWLAQKEDTQRDGAWIKLDRRRFGSAEVVDFAAGANGPDGSPLTDVTFEANVIAPDATERRVRLVPDGELWSGQFQQTTDPGDYRIKVTAKRDGEVTATAERQFLVIEEDLELTDPAANPQQLEQLAVLTRDAGGRTLAPEQLPSLLQKIRDQPPKMEIEVQSKWQLADTPLDAWIFFVCFVSLLSVEWFLRKKWSLV